MNGRYETLDAYLDALDLIKEKVAGETHGMTPKQVKAYFARTARRLKDATGEEVQVHPGRRKQAARSTS